MKQNRNSALYVAGTPSELAQRKIIRDNIITWRRERQRRVERVEKHDLVSNFNSVGNAMQGKRVFV